jgi:hypothetical protein
MNRTKNLIQHRFASSNLWLKLNYLRPWVIRVLLSNSSSTHKSEEPPAAGKVLTEFTITDYLSDWYLLQRLAAALKSTKLSDLLLYDSLSNMVIVFLMINLPLKLLSLQKRLVVSTKALYGLSPPMSSNVTCNVLPFFFVWGLFSC